VVSEFSHPDFHTLLPSRRRHFDTVIVATKNPVRPATSAIRGLTGDDCRV